jgi:peptidoglycan hydrolase CwlO-like protein
MFEYIEFYTKNLSNFTILLLIGALIAILDITFRNVVKDVYLNVRDNIRRKHGIGGNDGVEIGGSGAPIREGMENSDDGEKCPTECNAVAALQKRLSSLIESAAKLQKDIQKNNETIKKQQKIIENMQKSVDNMTKKK